ncbi:hypothetical protein HY628_02195 [Candidatus Uhrbacteria bacterium]|nr:hypothetical protein [Candidatus Uhrbacteria bacterium]
MIIQIHSDVLKGLKITTLILLAGLAAFLVIASALSAGKARPEIKVSPPSADLTPAANTDRQRRISEAEEITITVKPPSDWQADSWKFDLALDTHSVDLAQALEQVAALVDDQGNKYPPQSWEGSPPGGHHRTGILTFAAIRPLPSAVTLVIRDIGAPERTFVWEL